MVRHIRDVHPQEFQQVQEEEQIEAKKKKEQEEHENKKDETEKGGNKIWHLKSKKERLQFFQRVSIYIKSPFVVRSSSVRNVFSKGQ